VYPEIEPYEHGWLEVGEGHRIYWEICDNPNGKPALVLHGGLGSGCSTNMRRYYDPALYRVVLLDQRGSGRSLPHASEPDADLSANTTGHLLQDIERLRTHLGIERWLIFGGSWGSTLALAYAERQPERVTEMLLASIATTTPAEIDWITRGVGQFFPDAWEKFRSGAPEGEPLLDGYHRLLMSKDPAVAAKAASDWCEWENAIVAGTPGHKPHPRCADPKFRLGFARMVTHYWRHRAWLEDGVLLKNSGRIAHIPAVLMHGRLDLSCPLQAAWALAKAWPASELVILAAAGHDGRDPGAGEALLAATDRFARR